MEPKGEVMGKILNVKECFLAFDSRPPMKAQSARRGTATGSEPAPGSAPFPYRTSAGQLSFLPVSSSLS